MSISKIALTGCSDMELRCLAEAVTLRFESKGYHVLQIGHEKGGQRAEGLASSGDNGDFSEALCRRYALEQRMQNKAEQDEVEKVLIVSLGGIPEFQRNISREVYLRALKQLGTNEVEVRDSYDGVFCAEEQDACELQILSAWVGNPHLRILNQKGNLESKIEWLLQEVGAFLGDPEPLEIERRFLIQYPDLEQLENNPLCRKIEIAQTYLTTTQPGTVRVRRRGEQGAFLYYRTEKRALRPGVKVEIEERITEEAYLCALRDADPGRREIRKFRYCLLWKNQYFEIDVYPFWKQLAVMEIELTNPAQSVHLPEHPAVRREITGISSYGNGNLSRMTDAQLQKLENDHL